MDIMGLVQNNYVKGLSFTNQKVRHFIEISIVEYWYSILHDVDSLNNLGINEINFREEFLDNGGKESEYVDAMIDLINRVYDTAIDNYFYQGDVTTEIPTDFDSIYKDIANIFRDEFNNIIDEYCEREYRITVSKTITGSIVVSASSEDEAISKVEDILNLNKSNNTGLSRNDIDWNDEEDYEILYTMEEEYT